jgi:hypothetical protein
MGHPARHRLINLPRPISSRCNRAILARGAAVGRVTLPQTRSRVVLAGGSRSSWRPLLWSKIMQNLGERAQTDPFGSKRKIRKKAGGSPQANSL